MPSSSNSGESKLPEFAPMDPDYALARGLFRSVPKGSEKRTVELTYVVEGGDPERGWRREVEFISPYVLGPTDLRTLQGLLALAAQQAVYWEDRSWVLSRPEDELGRQLALEFKAEGDGADERVLQVTGSLADLARAVGLDERSGRAIATLKRSLKRLTAVTVWLRFAEWHEEIEAARRRFPASRSKREGSCRLASASWADGGGCAGVLRAAVNPQLSEVALAAVTSGGMGVKYIRMDMREVRALKLGAARLIHQRVCAWINPGGAGKVKLSTLCTYVFPDKAPTPHAAKRRRGIVRRALRELQGFEEPWSVDEYAAGKFAIARPDGVAERVVDLNEHRLRTAPEEGDGTGVDEQGRDVRHSVRCRVGPVGGKAGGRQS